MTAFQSDTLLTDDDRARISEIVCEVLDINPEEIIPDGSFAEENGADSMALIALSASLERAFDVEVEESELDRMRNLNGVLAVLGEAIAATRAAR
jgi:acyl carrier protein